MSKKNIYLDYAATTPVDPRVLRKMLPYFGQKFGNSMSLHSFGRQAKKALEESRQVMADSLGATASEIIFTGSATESNNLAIKGVAWANKNKGKKIIISPIEHHCVQEAGQWLKDQGFEIKELTVDRYGLVDPAEVERNIDGQTVLVSVIHASNEIGTIESIKEIGKICRKKGVLLHTDASQSFGKIPINVKTMDIDLLTASSHKMYGPKGAACLFVRQGTRIEPLLHGGGQEMTLRSSTVNVPAIVGFSEAVKICHKEMTIESARQTKLRDKLIKGVLKNVPRSHLNGHPKKRLPNNANFWFEFVEGESMVIKLDLLGVAVSTGSACSSAKLEPSHILLATGLKHEQAHGSLRVSLGRWTTEREIDYLLKILPKVVQELRKISPFKKSY